MATYNYYSMPQATAPGPHVQHNHHGRNRRAQRLAQSTVSKGQMRHNASATAASRVKDMSDSMLSFRNRFEATRSFDLEDDMEFCPNLLSDNDLVSIHSASSERSSLASNSPNASPTQMAQPVASTFSLNSSPAYGSAFTSAQAAGLKLHQPAASRARNPIPIINPMTGTAMHNSSPPPSMSPGHMHQASPSRRW